jgi:DNA invertase Pin-like site-specific DNA recombinase
MSPARPLKAALYCRVSTSDQVCENQLLALRALAMARGWITAEFVDHAQSGDKEKRPALDTMLAAVRARKVDLVSCVNLDRLARSVHHLVAMVREFEALGVDLVVLDQAIDTRARPHTGHGCFGRGCPCSSSQVGGGGFTFTPCD